MIFCARTKILSLPFRAKARLMVTLTTSPAASSLSGPLNASDKSQPFTSQLSKIVSSHERVWTESHRERIFQWGGCTFFQLSTYVFYLDCLSFSFYRYNQIQYTTGPHTTSTKVERRTKDSSFHFSSSAKNFPRPCLYFFLLQIIPCDDGTCYAANAICPLIPSYTGSIS